ncbi:MAG TPA: class I SAM-dependent methyltransferase [Candidatus Dormibacteraeota bacterium]|nr:class I SAM-dependent methyltransferase [Candidatus Dormibacteraeota bacterium]
MPFTFAERLTVCDLCEGTEFFVRDERAKIVQCRRCGYRFVNPRPTQEEIARSYSAPQQYDLWLSQDAGRRVTWRKRWDLVKRYANGNRLLDIGAGIGSFLAAAKADGWDVTGTEISTSAIEIAHRLYSIDLIRGQIEDIPLESRFDVVTMWHVLEHVPSPSRNLRIARELMSDDGLLVVAVPNDSDARWRFQRLKNGTYAPYEELREGAEIHLSQFTVPVLRKVLESNGFTIQRMTVDDHYAEPTPRSDRLVSLYRGLMALTGVNLAVATLALAKAS